ncbi:hypothetical protein HNR26_002313 [Rhizobium rosettiformans]|uniref:DNA-binding protein n=2 Tax=Rhizobium rosettiformans TaxID=1368430 RepID=A0A4S8Q310_9HYPH|nr:hypothetical protein [Rhizobium rosettiformans]MBB5276261.1 hypothetical protein [Rhizobium rosettiformans]THV36895.1 hypothetical protein FAA86_10385 [Rhizobium rosettiformans W3]
MPIQLWTPAQTVEFFHARGLTDINEKWVKNRCDNGDLPYTLVGRKRRIRSDVAERLYDNWVKEAI